MIGKVTSFLEKGIHSASKALLVLGGLALLVMVVWTTADVFGRYFLNKPLLGTFEVTEFLMVILIMSGLAFAAILRSHITIDVVVSRLPRKLQSICDVFVGLFSLGLFSLLSWRLFLYGAYKWSTGERTSILEWSVTPFAYFAAVASALLCLALLLDLVNSLKETLKQR